MKIRKIQNLEQYLNAYDTMFTLVLSSTCKKGTWFDQLLGCEEKRETMMYSVTNRWRLGANMLSELDQTQIPGTIHLHKLQVYKIALSFSLYSSSGTCIPKCTYLNKAQNKTI